MLKSLFFVLFLISTSYCNPNEGEIINKILDSFYNKSVKDLFKVWHLLFKKSYTLDSQEAKSRFRIFKDNLKYIKENNAQNNGLTLGLTEFSDLTNDEYRKLYLDDNLASKLEKLARELETQQIMAGEWQPPQDIEVGENKPFDHSKYFPPARSQGSCGSCWAFATVGAIEAAYAMKNGTCEYLSPQQLVDCDTKNYGCNGGWYYESFAYVVKNGMTLEKNYPYKAAQQSCKKSKIVKDVTVSSFKFCDTKSCVANNGFYNLLKEGPLASAVDAGTREFQNYKSGIIPSTGCRKLNHAIVALGYGIQNGKAYYIIRNSWGAKWGQNGNAFIAYSSKGSCYVDQYGFLPVFK